MNESIEGIIRRVVREELERAQLAGPARVSEQWLTTSQAAIRAGMHPKTIAQAISEGRLQATQRSKGSHWRIRAADLDAWMSGVSG